MKTPGSAFLLICTGLLSLAHAEVQLDILLEDLYSVMCFDSETCFPVSASSTVLELASEEEHAVPVAISGPSGSPLAYHFVLQGDSLLDDLGAILRFSVSFEGPGFNYNFVEEWEPFGFFYLQGPPIPPAIPETIPIDNGCGHPWPMWDWDLVNFPDGQVQLLTDIQVPETETLRIAPGMEILCHDGAGIQIVGAVEAPGSQDQPIRISGDNWGGIHFAPGGSGELRHTEISGCGVSSRDGGAFLLEPGAEVSLDHCLIAQSATEGRGGAAFVDSSAHLRLRHCTLSHNAAEGGGGNIYIATGGIVSGRYNLVTYGEPNCMEVESGPLGASLQVSNVYPLADPEDGTGWHCDPGYVDPEAGDFSISYYNPDLPGEANCTIDAALLPDELDPDGTPADMGAFPFDQHNVLLPPANPLIVDLPRDQGGNVLLHFNASPNDGSWINPISFYAVWVRHPGSSNWISSGQALGATGSAAYAIVVPTTVDSNAIGASEWDHAFRISAHASDRPDLVAYSDSVRGHSVDNLPPAAIAGLQGEDFWTEPLEHPLRHTIWWSANTENDLNHYSVRVGTSSDILESVLVAETIELSYTYHTDSLGIGERVFYFLQAVDSNGNHGLQVSLASPWRTSISSSGPLECRLFGNSPNPFNPVTTFRYDIAVAGPVSLGIYNMQGQLVDILVNEMQDVGRYELTFDASALASGVYLYHLEAGNFVQTRKMVLLK